MNGNIYGNASSASLNPKLFMVQALKKLLLNNGNILKFHNGTESDEMKERLIRLRLANSEALIEEMKKHLNLASENEAVQGVMMNFEWLLKEMNEINEYVKGRNPELGEELGVKLESSNYIVRNLVEGFEGLADTIEEKELGEKLNEK